MTTQQVADAFGVSYNTVVNYTERTHDPLPVTTRRRGFHTVRIYHSDLVAAWAARNKLTIVL